MINYPKAADIQQSIFIGKWNDKIPVYHVTSMHAFNQLVGYIKHINSENGTVLYRGQCNLYNKVCPSIKHNLNTENNDKKNLNESIDAILSDDAFMKFFGFRNKVIQGWTLYEKLIIEAAFQHYGAKTYCVDFVDNHWTALWFGLYKWNKINNKYIIRSNNDKDCGRENITNSEMMNKLDYPLEPVLNSIDLPLSEIKTIKSHALKGDINYDSLIDKIKRTKLATKKQKWETSCKKIKEHNDRIDKINNTAHLYLFLYVAETNKETINGFYIGENTYTIDLRKALPSTFLRPCSQHGWIVRGNKEDFDFNSRISCVIQININLAKNMLGTGDLLSQDNFFPSCDIDQDYKVLLARQKGTNVPSKLRKIIKEDMIKKYYN